MVKNNKGEKVVEGDYTAISQRMGITIPTMYNCIRKLQERGYVEQVEKGIYRVAQVA